LGDTIGCDVLVERGRARARAQMNHVLQTPVPTNQGSSNSSSTGGSSGGGNSCPGGVC
jgi:hypothetical protein